MENCGNDVVFLGLEIGKGKDGSLGRGVFVFLLLRLGDALLVFWSFG